jgi:membrane-associated phospholipid phosphatase
METPYEEHARQAGSDPVTVSRNGILLLSVIMVVAVALSMAFADLPVAAFFHGIGGSSLVQVAAAITDAGKAVWFLVASGILFLLFFAGLHRRREAMMVAFVFVSVAVSGIAADILKVLFGRPRPKLLFQDNLTHFHWLKFGHDWNSFPSGHSTTAAAVTAALCLLAPRWSAVFVPVGGFLIATRVITTAHYLSDTVFATYIGVTSTVWLYQRFQHRGLFKDKAAPLPRRDP